MKKKDTLQSEKILNKAEQKMDSFLSGSNSDIEYDLVEILKDPEFEYGLRAAFTSKRYSLKKSVKTPYWTYCSVSGMLIRIYHNTEISVVDEGLFELAADRDLIQCIAGDSMLYLPKDFIHAGSWH